MTLYRVGGGNLVKPRMVNWWPLWSLAEKPQNLDETR